MDDNPILPHFLPLLVTLSYVHRYSLYLQCSSVVIKVSCLSLAESLWQEILI